MIILSWIQFLLGAACMIGGLVFFIIQMIGVFRFKYVLNRMHAAALGDTMGVGLMMCGVMLLNGWHVATLKVLVSVIFLELTAPVASHLVAKLEVWSRLNPEDCCAIVTIQSKEDEA